MSLAVLKIKSRDSAGVSLMLDTGTNKYYYLKIGQSITEANGARFVDDIVYRTNLKQNKRTNPFFDSSFLEDLNIEEFKRNDLYVQLFSFRDVEGNSPSYSRILKINTAVQPRNNFLSSLSIIDKTNNSEMQTTESVNQFRKIAHCDASQFAMQSSFEDILSGIVRVAGPIVTGIINGMQQVPGASGAGSVGGGGAASSTPAFGMLNTILQAFLRGLDSAAPAASSTPAASAATAPAAVTAGGHSLSFSSRRWDQPLSSQMLFGIDDAILASLVGSVAGPVLENVVSPIINLVPQLVGSHNQTKLQNKLMSNRLITDLVSDVNRRMILQQFLQNLPASGSAGAPPNIGALLGLLAQAPSTSPEPNPAAAAIPATAPATSSPASINNYPPYVNTLSSKAILSFEHSAKHQFFGKEKHIYQVGNNISLKLKFNVIEPTPKTPLPKAIITVTFKDSKESTLFEKKFKQKDVKPNSILELPFSKEEIQKLTVNECVIVVAEMRWITSAKRVFSIFGSTEIVFVNNYFIKEQGKVLAEAKELSDMNIYRAFWNKIWESPVMDNIKQNDEDNRKIGWDLNGNLKYAVILTTKNESNGIMETKQLIAKKDEDRIRNVIEARMKSGIELSIYALNKMNTLWDKTQPLEPVKFEAFKTTYLEKQNISEFIYNLKLKGKHYQRGLVWVVPILKQQTFMLCNPKVVLPTGEVQETAIEEVVFPMPYSMRILGLRSE